LWHFLSLAVSLPVFLSAFFQTSCLCWAGYWSLFFLFLPPRHESLTPQNTNWLKINELELSAGYFLLLSVFFLSVPVYLTWPAAKKFPLDTAEHTPPTPFYTFVPSNLAPDEIPSLKRILRHWPSECAVHVNVIVCYLEGHLSPFRSPRAVLSYVGEVM